MFKIKNKKKLLRFGLIMAVLCMMMSVVCFADETSNANVTDVMTDLSTMVTSLLTNATAVFGFLTGPEVLPWVLLGVGVSLIGVCIWWVKWIIWGR